MSLSLTVTCQDIELTGLQVLATLGVGGFGRVELVKVRYLIISHLNYFCFPNKA